MRMYKRRFDFCGCLQDFTDLHDLQAPIKQNSTYVAPRLLAKPPGPGGYSKQIDYEGVNDAYIQLNEDGTVTFDYDPDKEKKDAERLLAEENEQRLARELAARNKKVRHFVN